MQRSDLERQAARLRERYEAFQRRHLSLDMTRGKPSPQQLDLSLGLLASLGDGDYRAADGTDCRNYGVLEGLPEARALFAQVLEVEPDEIIVAGNSSLELMHDAVVQALLRGVPGGSGPWGRQPVEFLCPSPGYDRHFAICERFGIRMITVPMQSRGPDMSEVERLAADYAAVKGIWCVPKYSNPTGVTFSDEVVERLARMKTAAPDFRIFWDNAYAVHHLSDEADRLANLLQACRKAGNAERVLIFGSTSKISFAGAGVAMIAASEANLRHFAEGMAIRTIGPDKLNQLRHVRFFRDRAGIEAHMRKHAALLRPKFAAVTETFARELDGKGIAAWSRPNGGYFLSLDTADGCAARVVAMAAEAGVRLTRAGATFPYGRDPRDRNIRIAPSLPALEEIREAMELVAICVQRAAVEQLLARG
jgi:DNA-binding transcriptional MocR family regulator